MSSPSSPLPTGLRKLSPTELFFSSRNQLGLYRSVTVTCRYEFSQLSSVVLIEQRLYRALDSVISSEPMLRVGVEAEDDASRTRFLHLPFLDLASHVSFEMLGSRKGEGEEEEEAEKEEEGRKEEYERLLVERLEGIHDLMWTELHLRPPWKLYVFHQHHYHDDDDDGEISKAYDMVFAFHHVLMDGISARIFHELLQRALNDDDDDDNIDKEPKATLFFPDPPLLPLPQEEAIPFTNSLSHKVKTVINEHLLLPKSPMPFFPLSLFSSLLPTATTPWHGKGIDFSLPHKSRLLPIIIPANVSQSVLEECRAHQTTVTALIHALVLSSLARRLPAGISSLTAATPISLRPYLVGKDGDDVVDSTTAAKLRCLVTSHRYDFTATDVSSMRGEAAASAASASDDGSIIKNDASAIWKAARDIRAALAGRLSAIPADDPIGMLSYVRDWSSFWKGRDGKPRRDSWEVSNGGVLVNEEDEEGVSRSDEDYCRISRVSFANGPMVAGPPIGLSVASAASSSSGVIDGVMTTTMMMGEMTIVLSWQEGVVPEELMTGLADDLHGWTRGALKHTW
ncbi:hypothetical protein CP532_6867 [Ophiocordyceps camponoti-leonardi (nom. inval.)]|nr:hypothetical protein CP532_6867 [Ophiocordyceps camponoti-leonardi (nom. inval.)]